MKNDYRVQINFLPVDGPLPPFRVYRKPCTGSEARPSTDVAAYSLPVSSEMEERQFYWVRFTPAEGYHEHHIHASDNNNLTKWAILHAIQTAVHAKLKPSEYHIPAKGFVDSIRLLMVEHPEGFEQLEVQPYFLRETQQFGCLADFHFKVKGGVAFSRRIQQLSLSLNRAGKRNVDYYLDRDGKIRTFTTARRDVLSGLLLPGSTTPISLGREFVSLPARTLGAKTYVFAGGKTSRSQFSGLRDHGPLEPLSAAPHLLFLFREQDRQAARILAAALKGTKGKERFNFPGFQALFKSDLSYDAKPIILSDLNKPSMELAVQEVQRRRLTTPNALPVLVLPQGDDNGYLAHKAGFANVGIATQVCTLPVIQDEAALKWAIGNIALQIFCKAGGQPWKVRPTTEPTLIVGISQSHRLKAVGDDRVVEKYFAFTVMTDNSGLFQKIQVLGDATQHEDYRRQLTTNLEALLGEASSQFKRVVVHTSFKLKRKEIDAIEQSVRRAAGANKACRFAVVKVNQHSRFFGVNRGVNSLVPNEATCVRLGQGEYLVWFEGINPDKPTVGKLFPGPTHLDFLRVPDGQGIRDDELLQDIINLSGANWRGLNAKNSPVSVFYCHLVADMVHDFHAENLPLPQVEVIRPWFL
ncbi:Piwi domain-containing protein [Fimbriiglobus ruber]|uniref:Protein argonaute n=1 Tax=Fimbriiglobus ruber TaxID=1908690 RepID=A0A225DCN9_9BACT|nr:Piwi domain-containing protein [Fimbriiglobus ruber]OWK37404.1 hypothetical protein FRUB_06524 [Fimbriiglobus ruber]